ncbi:InlB B-repeat-containing protein [Anaerostipes sp.]|uniref:InlB B-repeat-containing protein n=1 Tax=Anaerostipes sp. TaxID=1872530 RepID=UPI0025BEB083|nr:InlB B-repeat-containing protein [Anaerostipes sp.]MBS7009656.1 InlB B-repeat-containing protein [Anaerostipes sp.]
MGSETPIATEQSNTETKQPQELQTASKPASEKKKSTAVKKKTAGKSGKQLAENGQTLLDVSKGDIRITLNGATGGGLPEDETKLNPDGYWIKGTTDTNNVIVERDVTTKLTLDQVNITASSKVNCIDVSHANVTITLRGENILTSNSGKSDSMPSDSGNGLNKDGMDGYLTLQCESANIKGHRCNDSCGSLKAYGNPNQYHAGAIGSSWKNHKIKEESGFCNFTIKGGNIEASAGEHTPGIGSACDSEAYGGYTKNIVITGGNIKAVGTDFGSGIGSGYGNTVDGIVISGGTVVAYGGRYAPGIGASAWEGGIARPSEEIRNVKISGGDTVVIAIGDEGTGMPGIGSSAGNSKVFNVTADPEFGYQGYIQDGTSLNNYTFMDGTPFKEETAINVGRFYTKVYFGPYRDANGIANDTKEQIGANHVISKTGGNPFTEEQLKSLAKVTGKQENGTDFSDEKLTFDSKQQIELINEAKTAGKTGKFDLTFTTPNGTKATVQVHLKAVGTDAAKLDSEKGGTMIGADNFQSDTGGEAFSEDDVRNLAAIQGKDPEGTTYPSEVFSVNSEQLAAVNEAKSSGRGGEFPLTFTSPDNKTVTVVVELKVYDQITTDENTGETIKGLSVISQTGGKAFEEEELKELSLVKAEDGSGNPVSRNDLVFSEPEQLKDINQAKTSHLTGDYPLTIETPGGTKITIYVYLRENAAGKTAYSKGQGSLGANNIIQPTGGKAFGEEDIVNLCEAKGKDAYGNNVSVSVDKEQLELINKAKISGRTGVFKLEFRLEDGSRIEAAVTLTGDHTVSFDPDGGDYRPKDQNIEGGKTAVEPKEPKKDGYNFEGWFYTDEDGKEVKWNFDTPVHDKLILKAKWTKKPAAEETTAAAVTKKPDQTTAEKDKKAPKKEDTNGWKYREVGKNAKESQAAKTGDETKLPWVLGCMAGAAGFVFCLYRRKKIK